MKEKIIQFGTGNFLRGFADSFIDKLNKDGLYDGKIVIVSPTDSKQIDIINSQSGKYNLYLRGIDNNKEVCRRSEIKSVSRGINPYNSFNEFLALAQNPDFRFIISNTTEAGIVFDENCNFNDCPPSSFPAKLTRFLYERYVVGLNGFVIFACELIDNNAVQLKNCVLKYADLWHLGDEFYNWLTSENEFCNTLVDRIVTGFPKTEADSLFDEIGYEDKLLDTAEPYHLWAIEGDYEKELPFCKAGLNVVWTKDVSPYKKRKVRVLNGAHTSLVFPSLLCGVATVGESLDNQLLFKYLNNCLFNYILPTLGGNEENIQFAKAVIDRFKNPFISHSWRSISLNSVSKYSARVLPTVNDYFEKNNSLPKPLVFALSCLIEYYKTNEASDERYALNYIKENSVDHILENERLWGCSLSETASLVKLGIDKIKTDGIQKAIEWSMC